MQITSINQNKFISTLKIVIAGTLAGVMMGGIGVKGKPESINLNNDQSITISSNTEIDELKNRLDEITATSYFVSHEVQYGDSLSSLAALGSGSESETLSLVNEIMRANNLKNTNIQIGEVIYIVNPEIGKLKCQINEAQNQLNPNLRM